MWWFWTYGKLLYPIFAISPRLTLNSNIIKCDRMICVSNKSVWWFKLDGNPWCYIGKNNFILKYLLKSIIIYQWLLLVTSNYLIIQKQIIIIIE